MVDLHFTDEPLWAVLDALTARLAGIAPGQTVTLDVPDPDRHPDRFAGERVDGQRHRDWATWVGVAEQLGAALSTPAASADGRVRLALRKLDPTGWHRTAAPSGDPEKYGAQTTYARIDKFEAPDLVVAFRRAVAFIALPAAARVLDIGCNQGDALAAVRRAHPDCAAVGIDHSTSAIEAGRRRFPQLDLHVGDLNRFAALELGRFDLIVALNVLHSPGIDGQGLFRRLIAEHLTPAGGIIIGLPNSRYVGATRRFGAAMKGYRHPELSVLVKDAAFYKRYLARHRFRVTITGQHTVLVSGKPLPERVERHGGGRVH